MYQVVKVAKYDKLRRKAGWLEELIAENIAVTLEEHVVYQLRKIIIDDMTSKDLGGVFFIFSVFGIDEEVGLYLQKLRHQVNEILEEKLKLCADGYDPGTPYRLAKLFVENHWSHFAFQGTTQVKSTMQPTLVPFAQLVENLDANVDAI